MTTVRDILSDAMVECGANALGDSIEAQDYQFALRTLNRMIDTWNIDYGMIYATTRSEFSLVAGQQKYTIGTGGNFNMANPVRIDMVSVLIGGDTPEIPVDILQDSEWRDITAKDTTSDQPTSVWFTGAEPLNEAYFWPVPSSSTYKVVLYTWGKMGSYTSLDTTVQMPEGYEEALVTNLALHLCSSYGIPPSVVLASRAKMAKDSIRSINSKPQYLYSELSGSSDNFSKTFGYVAD